MGARARYHKMSTKVARDFRERFHNDATLYSVTASDIKPRSDKHASRMTPDQKKQMARRGEQFNIKEKAIKDKKENEDKNSKEYEARAKKIAEERSANINEINKMRENAAKEGKLFKEADDELYLVIRIKGTNKMAPKPKKIMNLLNLRKLNSAVFLRVNKSTMNMLKHVIPWVTFGKPTTETIRNLLLKRGHGRVGRRGHYDRVRITDNQLISRELGTYGIHGFEDLVEAIENNQRSMRDVKQFLAPFFLNSPTRGYSGTKKHMYSEFRGGASGYRGDPINDLAKAMM